MPLTSRWQTEQIPDTHLASLLFTSPTHPVSKTHRCYSDADNPETHYFTTHDFRLWCQRFAAGLRKSGLQTGDRVLLFSGNDLFFPVVFLGIIMAGGVFSSANPTYVARELAYQFQDSGATYLLCAESSLDTGIEAARLAGVRRDRVFVFNSDVYDGSGQARKGCRHWGELVASAEEGSKFVWEELSTPETSSRTLALNYSSGTTGKPKGVEVSHKNYVANTIQTGFMAQLSPEYEAKIAKARLLCFLPMYHAMGQTIFIANALLSGTPVYIMPKFDFIGMLEYVQKFRITELILVPPIMVRLAKHPAVRSGKYDLSSVEAIRCGKSRSWGPRRVDIKQAWGMTEVTCSFLGWDPRDEGNPASVGMLYPNCEGMIIADDGKTELGKHQRGELWVRGPSVMRGYWQKPQATQETKTADGWLKTGDIAYVDDDGRFYVVDRIKELIKVKGNQVAPAELEGLLLEHLAVADVAVIGVPVNDDERPRAYVVLKPDQGATAEDIIKFMDGKVTAVKRITGGVVFIDAIPKNPSGKILRKELRERARKEMKGATAKL
ncbi:acyl--CoA ligase [Aspergillus glaucus CBS 516.65]|uniref:4-coumarate-CoA ligase n=1 Tax=Aspergillus glaucus CBS 516.65 TaxID=1160497 RepID=A0A1L9VAG0_ASPGL|nr:hypothetical protein ASPGLDRAFT_69013 [Aspergillus glaucus CBS 516.65]OJJ80914.1 hypothetical protein ASPGLDRAFT_69013 [Aspergillus glaucus CBS 516.65]